MNKKKIFLSVTGIGLLIAAALFFILNFNNQNTLEINPDNLSIFEEDDSAYYLKKAPEDLSFEVYSDNATDELDYTLVDEAGNEVETRVRQKDDHTYEIRAPKSGYDQGDRYRLELGEEVLFANEELHGADSLVFAVDREEMEHYAFTDQVVEMNQEIVQVAPDLIEVDSFDFFELEDDAILFGQNEEDEYVIYKISEIIDEDTAQVTMPALDEIYSELEVYGEYAFDFSDIIINPEIEAQLVENFKNTSFFSNLVTTAYAEEKDYGNIEVTLEYTPNPQKNSIEIELVVTLKAGEDGLFGKERLKHHEVTITLKSEFGTSAHIDIDNVRNWDVAASRSDSFYWEVDISYEPPVIDETTSLSDLFNQDKEEDVKEIVRLLNEMTSDEVKNEILLFEQGVPISGIPGLIVSLEVNISLYFEIQANLNFNNDYSTMTTVGLMYRDSTFKPYYKSEYYTSGGKASFKGEMKSKAGLNFDLKTKLFHDNVAYISLKPEVGLYADAYVALTMNSLNVDMDNSYGYFESGTYLTAEVHGFLNTLIRQDEIHSEIDEVRNKFDKLSFGKYQIQGGLNTDEETINVFDLVVNVPEFTFDFYDIRSKTEERIVLDSSDLKYYLEDGESLKFKDNQLILPGTSKEELILRVEYIDDNGKIHNKNLTLNISEYGVIDHLDFMTPVEFSFSSGAGAWGTVITLHRSGYFTGKYWDANAGMDGNGYLSTNYISEFQGQFGEIENIGGLYSMQLLDIEYMHDINEEWIEDNIKYIASEAYGLSGGEEFFLFLPETLIGNLSEEFLSWARVSKNEENADNELGRWGLLNLNTSHGFFTSEYSNEPEIEVVETEIENPIPTNFDDIPFDNDYSGPGSEFIGTWNQVNTIPLDFAPNPWQINYKDGMYYIEAMMPGDPAKFIMTAEYDDGVLTSHNGTHIYYFDYENPDTLEIVLPETVESGNETTQFFFEDGYLQWTTETYGDLRDNEVQGMGGEFSGYTKE